MSGSISARLVRTAFASLLAAASWAGVASAGTLAREVEYYHLDGLGSVRAVTDGTGAPIASENRDYLPYGEQWCGGAPCAGVPEGQPKRFTGKERDKETGLDYFGARYYGASYARFTTIDPVYTWRDNLADPQRWNRYMYGRDNPYRYVDPDGRTVREAARWVELLWNKGKHIVKRHVRKDIELDGTKFKTNEPKVALDLVEQTIRKHDRFHVQNPGTPYERYLYEKDFNKETGREGQRSMRAITQPEGKNTEKVITGHPIWSFLIGLLPGSAVIEAQELGGEAAEAAGDGLWDWVEQGTPVGRAVRQREEHIPPSGQQP